MHQLITSLTLISLSLSHFASAVLSLETLVETLASVSVLTALSGIGGYMILIGYNHDIRLKID